MQEVETLAQEEEQEIVWRMKEVEEEAVELLIIFQILAHLHRAAQESFVQGCTPLCLPVQRNHQEEQGRTNIFHQFFPLPS